MKLEQARYIVAVYRTGSITQAAKDLYLSQPNISNSLKNLEQELGFKILTRSQNGAQFTEKGLSLVRHCQSILDEIDHIEDLQNQSSRLEFVIISPSYPPRKNAFVRLCNELSELNKYHLVMHYAQQYEAYRLISNNQADLAVLLSTNIRSCEEQNELRRRGLSYTHLCRIPCNINLAADHPILQKEKFNLQDLWAYPFVNYDYDDYHSPYTNTPHVSFINPDKLIRVGNGDERIYLITHTHAYGIGAVIPPDDDDAKNSLRRIPIPPDWFMLDCGYLQSLDRPLTAEAQRYVQLLKEELDFLKDIPGLPEE